MVDTHTNFAIDTHPEATKLYRALINQGVEKEEFDQGYVVPAYTGQCPSIKQDEFCVINAHDNIIQAQEVFAFAFNHWQEYQEQIQSVLEHPVPWSFDDKNPQTTYDQKIREGVTSTISKLEQIIEKQGIEKNSHEHKKLLAMGLFVYSCTPPKQYLTNDYEPWQINQSYLQQHNLQDFIPYLKSRGGLQLNKYSGNEMQELPAIQAINKRQGECTEASYILYACLKMANLNPDFIYLEITDLFDALPDFTEQDKDDYFSGHLSIRLKLDDETIIFDPANFALNPPYHVYTPLSLRQTYTAFLQNITNRLSLENQDEQILKLLDLSIAINPDSHWPYLNKCIHVSSQNNIAKGLPYCEESLNLNPQSARTYFLMMHFYRLMGDVKNVIAMSQNVIENNPHFYGAYIMLSDAYNNQEDFVSSLTVCEQALNIRPEGTPFAIQKILTIALSGDGKTAIDLAKTFLDSHDITTLATDQQYRLYAAIAFAQYHLKDWENALWATEHALQAVNKDPALYFLKANIYFESNEYEDANLATENGLSLLGYSFYDIQKELTQTANIEAFEEDLKEAFDFIGFSPDAYQPYILFGLGFCQLNALDLATHCFQKAAQINNTGFMPYMSLSIVYALKKDFKQSTQHIVKTIQIVNADPNYNNSDLNDLLYSLQDSLTFYLDRNYYDTIASYYANTLISYALWESEKKDKAIEYFQIAVQALAPETKNGLSVETRTLIKNMLKAMPAKMKKDTQIKEILKQL